MSKKYCSKTNYKPVLSLKNSNGFFAFGTVKPHLLVKSGGVAFFVSCLNKQNGTNHIADIIDMVCDLFEHSTGKNMEPEIPELVKYELYEIRKQTLLKMNLSPEDYESEIRKIIDALGL